jgi:Xaa-Pro dipeptidase
MIESCLLALEKLEIIMARAFEFIGSRVGKVSEKQVQRFILKEFDREGLVLDRDEPIVAVNESASHPHYFPGRKSKKICREDLVLIDIWARLKKGGSVYADITWMGLVGNKIEGKRMTAFKDVLRARDLGIKFIRKELREGRIPTGYSVDKVVRNYFKKKDLDKFFIHSTGHSIGSKNCHGDSFNLSKKCKKKIKIGIPFTIEPGLYFPGEFGVRSEIDCYIDSNMRLKVMGKVQKVIVQM